MLNYFDINQLELEYLSDENKIQLEHSSNATIASNMQEKTIPSHGTESKTDTK